MKDWHIRILFHWPSEAQGCASFDIESDSQIAAIRQALFYFEKRNEGEERDIYSIFVRKGDD